MTSHINDAPGASPGALRNKSNLGARPPGEGKFVKVSTK